MRSIVISHKRNGLFTSESVGKGHPDKICDQIADSILDHILKLSPDSRVACEVLASNRLILIGGEITTTNYVDVVQCAWDVIKPLGYTENDFTIISNINSQSLEIAQLVDHTDGQIGAGDQGITIGYAVAETNNFMPWSTFLAHELLIQAEEVRSSGLIIDLKSDMKSQVTIEYKDNEIKINNIIISAQHSKEADLEIFRNQIIEQVIVPVLTKYKFIDSISDLDKSICFINPSGTFIVGGPIGDTGLTGRKLMVDSYGPYAHHGGGAYSGKDYTKVDRTGAYYARWIAKHIVALNWATECEVKISWAIGSPKPLDISIDCFNTNQIPLAEITKKINSVFNHNLKEIINLLNLQNIQYLPYATFGHFGKEFAPWEELVFLEKLK